MNQQSTNQTIVVIPARGGSKGIPRKNIMKIAGHPLLAWAIMTAKESMYAKRIIVSTDDKEIARIAQHYGSQAVMRPAEISGDSASSELALLHVLDHLKINLRYVPDFVIFMQCTSPLTSSYDVDNAVELFLEQCADVVFSATHSNAFLWRTNKNGQAVGVNHDIFRRPMRQQREPEFRETGAFYIMRTSGFIKHRHRFFGKVMIYPVPPERSLDIDEPWEVPIAELLLRRRKSDK